MGQGGYCFCEWRSAQKEYPAFTRAMQALETKALSMATQKWFPKKDILSAFGYLDAKSGEQFGRVPILPGMFDGANGLPLSVGSWRQTLTALQGHQTLLSGVGAGHTIPEDIMIALSGFAFPNQEQHISEIKMQIGDQKYGRINLEEMKIYDKPALIFEEGIIVDEEQAFDLYGYIDLPILPLSTALAPFTGTGPIYQYIIPLGFAMYRIKDKLLGNCGALVT